MPTISFKSDDELKQKLQALAKRKGINASAYIKLVLTKEVNGELAELTENGLTVAEELHILHSAEHDETEGPFTSTDKLMRALKRK